MEVMLHSWVLACLVVCLLSRLASALPVLTDGFTHLKHETKAVDATESSELEQLKRHVEQLASDLAQTKDSLNEVKEQMNAKFELLSSRPSEEMTCRTEFTWWAETVGRTLEYLDSFDVHCRHGEFLRQWRMTWGERETKKAIRYVCCKFTFPTQR